LHFAPDTEATLAFAVALANTDATASRSAEDELPDVPRLMQLLDEHSYSGRRDRDAAELDEVRRTRSLIRGVWRLDRDAAVAEVNRMLADAGALPQLVRHDDLDWHLHATASEAPLAERIRAEIALALVDVLRSNETGRLRVCEADDCEGLLVDLSRNGSKRYCSVRCGNRMNMVAFRERQAADA
jgi:predicted RNA-binding Zn ribbon-like protein